MQSKLLTPVFFLVTLSAGCAGFRDDLCGTPQVYTYSPIAAEVAPAFPRHCLIGDFPVVEPGMCTGIHCYQLDTGDWCAGVYSPFVLEMAHGVSAEGWSK